jgi:hypothetical protein
VPFHLPPSDGRFLKMHMGIQMLNERNIRWFFPRGHDVIRSCLLELASKRPDVFKSERGWLYQIYVDATVNRRIVVPLNDSVVAQAGSTRLQIYSLKHFSGAGITFPDVSVRVDVPLEFFKRGAEDADKQYHLYQIRFSAPDSGQLTEDAVKPLFAGYAGITKRHPFQRLAEHYSDVRSGRGHLLHSVWRSLLQREVLMHPVFQWAGMASTLKGIYAIEEKCVDQYTLAPKGLNAIPGGEAGIRMLHQLSLLKGRKLPGIAERDAALALMEQQAGTHGSPCTHYRTGHLRKIAEDRITWVSPCWVNLKEAA